VLIYPVFLYNILEIRLIGCPFRATINWRICLDKMPLRVNIGCGPNPIPGWVNFDNSLSVRLAAFPVVVPLLNRLGFLGEGQKRTDKLIAKMLLAAPRLRRLREKIKLLLVGYRHHLWMYDGSSLVRLLLTAGFSGAHVFGPGQTLINNPVGLDLYERMDESVYVEGHNGSY